MTVRFGPSGISDSFYEEGHKSSVEMPEWLYNMGLDAYEYSFSRGVKMSENLARELRENAGNFGITITIHAPYYINLASTDEVKIENSRKYLIDSLIAGNWMGAKRITFHPGSASEGEREEALKRAKKVLKEILKEVENRGLSYITLCPETMGKKNQLGTLEEVLELCQLDERLIPTIDFAHLHARDNGRFKSIEDYAEVLDIIEKYLGKERAKKIHVHFSRIEYTVQGEKRHWTLKDTQYGPEFEPLAQLFCERKMEPIVICESRGTMAEDALKLKEIYLNIAKRVSEV
ncbi:MAG TPA: TIM barrel protein [Clostridia bacterium]|nr:TIM barrel protein [Clostridia bacterium]